MADIPFHSPGCLEYWVGHDHPERQHHQIHLLLSRFNEEQGPWLVGPESKKIGNGANPYLPFNIGRHLDTMRGRSEDVHACLQGLPRPQPGRRPASPT